MAEAVPAGPGSRRCRRAGVEVAPEVKAARAVSAGRAAKAVEG
ncbi:hypothetical protein I547_5643 [Mycobacterium kansasii 824]|nr:hypothetical protein I547_5643 [Mycobacterium kansasii 824]